MLKNLFDVQRYTSVIINYIRAIINSSKHKRIFTEYLKQLYKIILNVRTIQNLTTTDNKASQATKC